MKPLSVATVAIATSLLVLCTSFHPLKKTAQPETAARVGNLFWYIDGGTVYDDWVSADIETGELEDEYGVLVDTNPVGGTLLAGGYPIYGYPHLIFASSYLYGHF
jgi:hypothetical protein